VPATDLAPPHPLQRLYAEHHGWLRDWLRRKLGNAHDAADLAHDTYLRLLRSGHVPPQDESRRHLAQVANGLVVDLYRRRAIETAFLEALTALPPALAPSPEDRALAVEALVQLDAALQSLSPKAREALLLCRLDGLGYREIATRLGVSVSSVEKYVAAALLACHQALQPR